MTDHDNPPSDWGYLTASAIQSIKDASREGTREGTLEGIRAAVGDEQLVAILVDSVFVAARREVQAQSGRMLWSGVAGLLSRVGWMLLIAAGITALGGGWSGVVAFFKAAAAK